MKKKWLQNSCRTHINGDIDIVSLELERTSYMNNLFKKLVLSEVVYVSYALKRDYARNALASNLRS